MYIIINTSVTLVEKSIKTLFFTDYNFKDTLKRFIHILIFRNSLKSDCLSIL